MKPTRTTLTAALRQKAKGERNSLGDVWTDGICDDAADMIDDLADALRGLELAVLRNGEWDDGCFYHNGTSATELQGPLATARAALRRAKGEA